MIDLIWFDLIWCWRILQKILDPDPEADMASNIQSFFCAQMYL